MSHYTQRKNLLSTPCKTPYRYFLPVFISLFSSLLFLKPAHAQPIGNWTFNSTLAGTPGLYNTAGTADFSAGVPVHTFNGGSEYYGENGWPAGALNTAMYMQFSLTPVAGFQLDLSTIVLRLRRSNTGSPAGSGPTAWALRSSLDGFTSNIAAGSMTHNYADYTVSPGAAFTTLYTTVVFRLYGYATTISSGGNNRFVIDNIRTNGIGYLLPAKLGSVSVSQVGQAANLAFTVYHSIINDSYLVQRSTDGQHFKTIATIIEAAEKSESTYLHADDISALATDKVYYRIGLLNNTGAVTFSDIITVRKTNTQLPVRTYTKNNQLYIQGVFIAGGTYHANLYSTNGQPIKQFVLSAVPGYNTFVFQLDKQLRDGCIIHLGNNKGYSSAVFAPLP
ncbi:MAG: hypothetical protein ABIU63_12500 [Chitinophagaceae bacterium]